MASPDSSKPGALTTSCTSPLKENKNNPPFPQFSPSTIYSCDKLASNTLKLFISECFYDCSFKIIPDSSGESKVFRCHKVILATCSDVFKTMLFGPFKEGKVDRDYKIILTETSPEVFDLAMRHVYGYGGAATDFKSLELAVQVYIFAQQWLMDDLMEAVEKFLKSTVQPKDILKVLEHFTDFVDADNPIGCYCYEVIMMSTLEVVSSKSWLEAPEEVVRYVLQMNSLRISEAMLFVCLLKWGRAQVKNEADLRPKIYELLKLVNFCLMDSVEFSSLCSKPIPLTAEEQIKIFRSIAENNPELLPEGYSNSRNPRCSDTVFNYKWKSSRNIFCTVNDQTEPVILTLAVEPLCYLNGLILRSLTEINLGEQVHVTCEVFSSEQPSLCIMSTTYNRIVSPIFLGTWKFLQAKVYFPYPVLMKQGIFYTIKLTYKHKAERSSAAYFTGREILFDDKSDFSDKFSKVRIMFAIEKKLVNPIVDVFGLMLGKINCVNLSLDAFSNHMKLFSRGYFCNK